MKFLTLRIPLYIAIPAKMVDITMPKIRRNALVNFINTCDTPYTINPNFFHKIFIYELNGFVNILDAEFRKVFTEECNGWVASNCFEKIAMIGPNRPDIEPLII